MPAPKVRANYDALKQISEEFCREAEAIGRLVRANERAKQRLEAGDWLGQGARSFYAEMDSDVLPKMRRLVNALEEASRTTMTIGQVMHRAEDEAARVLRGTGAVGPVAFGVGSATTVASGLGTAIPTASPAGGTGQAGWTPASGVPLEVPGEVIEINESLPVDADVAAAKYINLLSYYNRMYTKNSPSKGDNPYPLGTFTQAEANWLHANHPEWYQELVEARAAAWERWRDELIRQSQLARQRFGAMMGPVGDVAEALAWGALVIGGVGMALTVGAGLAGGEAMTIGTSGTAAGSGGALGATAPGLGFAATWPGPAAALAASQRFVEFIMRQIALEGGSVDRQAFERIVEAAVRLFGDPSTRLP